MSDDNEQTYQTEDTLINKKTELSLIWLLPIIALIVSGWLIYKALLEQGATIIIDFPTAEGLEIDKTKIKYLDVDIGKVTAITINTDLKTIAVSAEMNRDAEQYLTKNTRFWVVRPQVGLGGISGLNTLLSGAYIAIKPEKGERQTRFMGLATPPLLKVGTAGTQFILEANELGAMRAGTPINFHGINVGEVLSHKLDTTANAIHLTIFINAPYDQFVRKNTRFWIDSGIDLSAGADGFKVRTGPLISLLSGGIAFRTDNNISESVTENSLFPLYDSYEQSTQEHYHNPLKYVMHFNSSVRGLTEGAPVQLRGIAIGKVTHISLELDEKTAEIHVPVEVELEPERIKVINNLPNISHRAIMTQLIDKGLRAQLQTGSLLTGQLLIDLDFHVNNKAVVLHRNNSPYAEFPTVTSSLDQFTHSAQTIMDKIAKLPLDTLTIELTHTLQKLQATSTAATLLLHHGKTTLVNTDKTLHSAQQVLNSIEPGATTRYEFDSLLQQLTQTANSVKQLTDYLQQHPDTVLRGKKE